MLFLLSSSSTSPLLYLCRKIPLKTLTTKTLSHLHSTMSTNLKTHAFAGNPLRSTTPKPESLFSPISAFETLKSRLLENALLPSSPIFKVLPFRKGRPLAISTRPTGDSPPIWHLGWFNLGDFKGFLANSEFQPTENSFVYLGSRSEDDVVYWGIDVSEDSSLVPQFGAKHFGFVELRTLMVATDWTDERAMSDLAIAGHVSGYDFWMRVHLFASFLFFFFLFLLDSNVALWLQKRIWRAQFLCYCLVALYTNYFGLDRSCIVPKSK